MKEKIRKKLKGIKKGKGTPSNMVISKMCT